MSKIILHFYWEVISLEKIMNIFVKAIDIFTLMC
jgi:hypothetical protein